MAIQPIDLQAIFAQMDKVGKNQAALKEGSQLHESLQQIQNQKKLEENVQSVNQAQDMGKEAETIRDENRQSADKGAPGEKKSGENDDDGDDNGIEADRIRDPALGRNIDISG